MSGRLFVCATPIGNLEDASHRLTRVLSEVDAIAAEDTRRTRKLLSHYGIHNSVVSHHEGNERRQVPLLMSKLRAGQRIALVTDSGMPAISDPGYLLISACIRDQIPVEVVPGPSAPITALVASGLPTARFAFEGFLSRKVGDRRRRLEQLADDDRTLIFFEAPGRLEATLRDIEAILGNRKMAMARELTKIHEDVVRANVSDVLAQVFGEEIKGEVVLVVSGAEEKSANLQEAVERARELTSQGMTKSKAASEAASRSSVTKREIYERLLSD